MYKLIRCGINSFDNTSKINNMFVAFVDERDPKNIITINDITNGDDASRQYKVLESLGVVIEFVNFKFDNGEADIPIPVCTLNTAMVTDAVSLVDITANSYELYYRDEELQKDDKLVTNDADAAEAPDIMTFINAVRGCFIDCDDSEVDKTVKRLRLEVSNYSAIQSGYLEDEGNAPFSVYNYSGRYNSLFNIPPMSLSGINDPYSDVSNSDTGDVSNPACETVGLKKIVNGEVRTITLPTFAEIVCDTDSTKKIMYDTESDIQEDGEDSANDDDDVIVDEVIADTTSEFTSNDKTSNNIAVEGFMSLYNKSKLSLKPYVIGKYETSTEDYGNVIDANYPNEFKSINDFYNLYKPSPSNLPPETFHEYTTETGVSRPYTYTDITGHSDMNELDIQRYESEFYSRLVDLVNVGRSIEHNALSTQKFEQLSDSDTSKVAESYIKILAEQAFDENYQHTGRTNPHYIESAASSDSDSDSGEKGEEFELPCLIGKVEGTRGEGFTFTPITKDLEARLSMLPPSEQATSRRDWFKKLTTEGDLRDMGKGFKKIAAHVDEVASYTRWPDTLIKLLRFGSKKPNILCIKGSNSYYNLNDNCKTLFNGNTKMLHKIVDSNTGSSCNIDAIIYAKNKFSDIDQDVKYLVNTNKINKDVADVIHNVNDDIEVPIAFMLREVNAVENDDGVLIPVSEIISIIDCYELISRVKSGTWNINNIKINENGEFDIPSNSVPIVKLDIMTASKIIQEMNNNSNISIEAYRNINKKVSERIMFSLDANEHTVETMLTNPLSIAKAFINDKFRMPDAKYSNRYNEKLIASNLLSSYGYVTPEQIEQIESIDTIDSNTIYYPDAARLILFSYALQSPEVMMPNTNIATYYNQISANVRTSRRSNRAKSNIKNLNIIYCFSQCIARGVATCMQTMDSNTSSDLDMCTGYILDKYFPRYVRATAELIDNDGIYSIPKILKAFYDTDNDEVITSNSNSSEQPEKAVTLTSDSDHYFAPEFLAILDSRFNDCKLYMTEYGGYIAKNVKECVLLSFTDLKHLKELSGHVAGIVDVRSIEPAKKETILINLIKIISIFNTAYKKAGLTVCNNVESLHSNYLHPIPYKAPDGYSTIRQVIAATNTPEIKDILARLKGGK